MSEELAPFFNEFLFHSDYVWHVHLCIKNLYYSFAAQIGLSIELNPYPLYHLINNLLLIWLWSIVSLVYYIPAPYHHGRSNQSNYSYPSILRYL